MPTTVTVPNLGDSVTQATLLKWYKNDGDKVDRDDPLCELETDKANADVTANEAGFFKRAAGLSAGAVLQVGQAIGEIGATAAAGTTSAAAAPAPSPAAPSPAAATAAVQDGKGPSEGKSPAPAPARAQSSLMEDLAPAVRRMIEEHKIDPSQITPTGLGGRLTKEDVIKHMEVAAPSVTASPAPEKDPQPAGSSDAVNQASAPSPSAAPQEAGAGVIKTPMSKLRKRIAENLVRAQQTAAILTTFNEVDLTAVMAIRGTYKEKFEKTHGIGLGFMSFFAKAVCRALKDFPRVNGQLEGDNIVTYDYVNLGIAVSTERGLAVPVLRNAHTMSFAKIESEIKRLAGAVRDGKLGVQELSGGTFTITNGGVFGSLLSTPILNSPQSGILGMHTIQKRPVVVDDQIVIRPMMYVALSYDHRLVDGRESVSFLVRIKDLLEDPSRL
ncbi:MAG TPA: 2-oxoglutarate dehydrogenase complex dihydrolipoyllysine-residue succinyltransferase, partial [Tepidisphaeraceae bacterium]